MSNPNVPPPEGQPLNQQPYGQSPYGQPSGPPAEPQQDNLSGMPMYGQPTTPQYGQPAAPQYGQPQPAYGQPQYGQPYGQPGQPQYAQPYGQPVEPQYGQPEAPQYGQPQPPYGSAGPDVSTAAMAHWLGLLLGVLTATGLGWVGPLIIFVGDSAKSDPFVRQHAASALNFQITWAIAGLIASLSMFACVGFVLFPVVFILGIVWGLKGSKAASRGEMYQYPYTYRFVS